MQEEIHSLKQTEQHYIDLKDQHSILQEKVKILQIQMGNNDPEAELIRRDNKQLMNRGIQTKKVKQKEKNMQTDLQY